MIQSGTLLRRLTCVKRWCMVWPSTQGVTMTLREYLDATGASQKLLAASVGVSEAAISLLANGKRTPGVVLAVAIERATHGAVTCEDWAGADGAVVEG